MEARKSCGVVEKKVSAIKALYEVEQESCDLPTTFSCSTIDDVVRERLEADHLFAQFDKALILKAHAVLSKVELPEEWETMTRGRRNLAPQQERGTTVNVSQQASAETAAVATSVPAPDSRAAGGPCAAHMRRIDGPGSPAVRRNSLPPSVTPANGTSSRSSRSCSGRERA